MAGDDRVLVTGAGGCLGAWAVHQLVTENAQVVAFDVSEDRHRLRLLLDDDQLDRVEFAQGDLRDQDTIESLVVDERITHIVHLAALQVPFCIADPVLGAQVNVTGTVNVLEAARRSDGVVRGISYASSVAVFGPGEMYEGGVAHDDSPLAPATLYGAYKQANEWTAAVYAADWGVGSVGLRPCIVYGPGRDQGLTSDPTKAMVAAATGGSGHIAFGGSSTFHHAEDAAACFLAAARLEANGADVYNVGGPTASIAEVAAAIDAVAGSTTTYGDAPLALPSRIDGSRLDRLIDVKHRALEDGVAASIAAFRDLVERGLVDAQP